MVYPESCFAELVGIRGLCEPKQAQFWLDDIPGISLKNLAKLADSDFNTGKKLGINIIETAAKFVAADVEAIYNSHYKVESSIVSGCSTCEFLNSYATGNELGILINNSIGSQMDIMLITSIKVKINNTGTFNIVIDDGHDPRVIEFNFEAGIEYNLKNINYETTKKSVRIYFQESEVMLAKLLCKTHGGCGCVGKKYATENLIFNGTSNGVVQQQMYGFVPCVLIKCNADDLLCHIAKSAPRMVGIAMLYKAAQLYFSINILSDRVNKVASMDVETKKTEGEIYEERYLKKLNGKGGRGLNDVVFATLKSINDPCVVCNTLNTITWAAG